MMPIFAITKVFFIIYSPLEKSNGQVEQICIRETRFFQNGNPGFFFVEKISLASYN